MPEVEPAPKEKVEAVEPDVVERALEIMNAVEKIRIILSGVNLDSIREAADEISILKRKWKNVHRCLTGECILEVVETKSWGDFIVTLSAPYPVTVRTKNSDLRTLTEEIRKAIAKDFDAILAETAKILTSVFDSKVLQSIEKLVRIGENLVDYAENLYIEVKKLKEELDRAIKELEP